MNVPTIKKLFITPTGTKLIKIGLSVVYATVCACIILPGIDHTAWYPSNLATFDTVPGVEFAPHKEMTIDLSTEDLSESEQLRILDSFATRLEYAGILDSQISVTRKSGHQTSTIVISIPETTEDQTLSLLAQQGVIRILNPKEGVDVQTNPSLFFDTTNFEDSGLMSTGIESAEITADTEQYTYLTIKTSRHYLQEWVTFSQEHSQESLQLLIDGMPYQAWILPPGSSSNTYPTLVITFTAQQAAIISAFLTTPPLPIDHITPDIQTVEPTYSTSQLHTVYIALAVLFVGMIIVRRILVKESTEVTAATALMVIGGITILKLTSIPLSTMLLAATAVIVILVLAIPTTFQIPTLIVLALSYIPLSATASPELLAIRHAILSFAVFALCASFILQFFEIYEER